MSPALDRRRGDDAGHRRAWPGHARREHGWRITHSEIRTIQDLPGAEAAIPADVKLLTTPSISNFVTDTAYVWPVCEVFHFIGLALLMGIVLVINLRISASDR